VQEGESLRPLRQGRSSGEATFISWQIARQSTALLSESIPRATRSWHAGNNHSCRIVRSKYGKPPPRLAWAITNSHSKTPPALPGVPQVINPSLPNLTVGPPSKCALSPRQPGDRPMQLKAGARPSRDQPDNKAWIESQRRPPPSEFPLCLEVRSPTPSLRHPLSGPASPPHAPMQSGVQAGISTGICPIPDVVQELCAKPTGRCWPINEGWSPD